jgi:hypothetical protein
MVEAERRQEKGPYQSSGGWTDQQLSDWAAIFTTVVLPSELKGRYGKEKAAALSDTDVMQFVNDEFALTAQQRQWLIRHHLPLALAHERRDQDQGGSDAGSAAGG